MWLAVLTLSSVVVCLEAIHGHQYFPPGSFTLFPDWPQSRVGEIFSLLTITFGVLLIPKLLGATLALKNKSLRRGFGGTFRLLVSLVIEQVFSMLLAPAMMLFHTTFVLTTLAGKPVTWNAQDRGDRGIGFMEALRRHKVHVAIGLLWGAVIVWIAPKYIWWLMPVLAGMVLSVPLTMWTSRASAGRWLRRAGLLVTPEETATPAELAALNERMSEPAADISVAAAAQVENAVAIAAGPISEMASEIIVKDVPEVLPETVAAVSEESPVLVEVPPRAPLRMEAAAPEYLRPRDALSSLQRFISAASSSSA
jgi:membrane glycosyltransferase